MNRLAGSTSPYLRQHADNPVDWFEWGDEAFAEARRRDVPILLSVGYSACHWCHVMAHESFEDAGVAALMNEHFVNIKVDREERPDIDAVYMDATTAMTGHGGWPMTCLLTPDAAPFYCGTYFPRDNFVGLLRTVAQAWAQDRAEVIAAGQRIVDALREQTLPPSTATLGTDDLDRAAGHLVRHFDREHGGFGTAPKFPPSMVLEFLLRAYARKGDELWLTMADETFEAMARGGMYDQLGGGFARYSVDAAWVVPHFEKMLYDNALLLRGYVHWWRVTGTPLAERVARETAEFVLRDLLTAEGGFAAALDADTDGVEGLTYAWTPVQLAEVLGPQDAAVAAAVFAVTAEGTFEHGSSTLQLPDDTDPKVLDDLRARLFAARSLRPQPARDDKVVTAWNGLMIAALAEAGSLLHEARYLDAATASATLLLGTHLIDGRLRRASRDGVAGAAAAVAEDYGDLAEGLLALYQATAGAQWLDAAGALLDTALVRFRAEDGGFHDTADDAEQLVRRPREPSDNATPAGSSAIASALLTYSALTGSGVHREAAEATIALVGEMAMRQPRFFGWTLAAAEALADGPVQIAIVGEPDGGPLTDTARRLRPPGAVIVSGQPDAAGQPLLADRPLVGGAPTAYVCRGMVCDLPVTFAEDLEAKLH